MSTIIKQKIDGSGHLIAGRDINISNENDKGKWLSRPKVFEFDNSFIKRGKELSEIIELLNNSNILNLYGHAGVGKTVLSEYLLSTCKEEYDYIGWLDYQGSIIMTMNCNQLTIITPTELNDKSKDYLKLHSYHCQTCLTNLKGKKILIIDNIIDNKDIESNKDLLFLENFKIILTSRERISGFNSLRIDFMNDEDSLKLLKNYISSSVSSNEYETLIEKIKSNIHLELFIANLRNHPLAIKLLASNIESFQNFELFVENLHSLKSIEDNDEFLAKLIISIYENSSFHHSEKWILLQLSAIPIGLTVDNFASLLQLHSKEDIITTTTVGFDNYLMFYSVGDDSNLTLNEILKNLTSKAWIEIKEDFLQIPDLIRETVNENEKLVPDYYYEIFDTLHIEFFESQYGIFNSDMLYANFLERLIMIFNFEFHNDDTINLIKKLIDTYRSIYQLRSELRVQKYYTKLIEYKAGINSKETGWAYFNLSRCLERNGIYNEALINVLKSHDILALHQLELNEKASLYNIVGYIYHKNRKFEKSLEYSLKELDIVERIENILGYNTPGLATAYNNVAVSYAELGNLEKNIEYGLKNLQIMENILDKDNPTLGIIYHNIAQTYRELKKDDEYVNYEVKYVRIMEKQIDNVSPELGESYFSLASTYFDKQRIPNAKFYIEQAIKILSKVLPENHPDFVKALNLKKEIK